jgi:hypothetical protein
MMLPPEPVTWLMLVVGGVSFVAGVCALSGAPDTITRGVRRLVRRR